VLHPSVTERFTRCAPGLSGVARRTLRTNLRFIGRRVVPHLYPADAPLPRERAKQPYSPAEISGFLALADAQPAAGRRMRAAGVIALESVAEGVKVGQVVGANGGDPCVETLSVAAGQHLRELFDVTAQGVQLRAGSPHLLELELLADVEVVGAAADPAGDVTNLGRPRDGGRRGLPLEGGQVGVDGGVAAAKAQRLDVPV
jgi:hypothetical protein